MKKTVQLGLLLGMMILLCACTKVKPQEKGIKYNIYYVNYEETGIFAEDYYTETTDEEALLAELVQKLGEPSQKLEYNAPLAGPFSLLSYDHTKGKLTMSFDEAYKELPVTTEVLTRAAIVRTLTQIDGIKHIAFLIGSDPLTDSYGSRIGNMTAESFIDNAGNEINSYEKVKLTLYFGNENGDKLQKISRTVVYNSNVSMERLVVEQLLLGPIDDEKVYPVMNPATKIISVTVKDGICYVNFRNEFLTQIYNVTSDVTIYSLTNSLVELPNVNKVQISIDGDTNVNFKENISFSTLFERNLEIVE